MPGIKIALTADEAAAALSKFRSHLKTTGMEAIKTEADLKKLESQMLRTASNQKISSSFGEMSKMMGLTKKEADSLSQSLGIVAKTEMGGLDSMLGGMAGKIGGAVGAMMTFAAVMAGVKAVLGTTMQYLATLETASLGIASAFMVSGKYIDNVTGKELKGIEAFKVAQYETKSVMKDLQIANFETTATLDQLVRAYQETLPVAMSKGFNKKQVLDFTKSMVQAAGAIGLPFEQMGEETRSILTGNINPRTSRIATVLGLRNEDIKAYKGNAEELFNFLMQRLEGFTVAGIESQKTWTGLWSNIKDIGLMAGGQMFGGVFEGVKGGLAELAEYFVKMDETGKVIGFNPDFMASVESIRDWFSSMVNILEDGVRMALYDIGTILGTVYDLVKDWASGSGEVWELIGKIWDGVMMVATACAPVVKWLNQWLNPLMAFRDILANVAKTLYAVATWNVEGMKAGVAALGKSIKDKAVAVAEGALNLPGAVTDALLARDDKKNKIAADRLKREQARADKEKFKPGETTYKANPQRPEKEKKGKESPEYAIAQAVEGWKEKVEALNPELEKEGKEIAKIESEARKLIDRIEHMGKKGKIDVSADVAAVQADLDKAKQYITQKYQKKIDEQETKRQSQVVVNTLETQGKLMKMENDYQTKIAELKLAKGEASERDIIKMKSAMQKQAIGVELAILEEKLKYEQTVSLKKKEELIKMEAEIAKVTGKAAPDRSGWETAEVSALRQQITLKKEELSVNEKLLAVELEMQKVRQRQELGYWDPSYAQFQKGLIAQKAKDMQDNGFSEIAIRKWVANSEKKIEIEKNKFIIENSDNVLEVMRAQNQLYALETKNLAQQVNQVYTQGVDALKSTTSDFFNDFFNGELKNATDYFQSFAKSLNRIFADMIAEMMTKNLIGSLFGGTSGNNYTSNASSGGGFLSGIGSLFSGLFGGFSGGGGSFGGAGASAGWDESRYGNVFMNRNIIPFRSGGVVRNLSYFPMANGGIGSMAEEGPEAIMPLARTKGGKLGVQTTGGNTTTNLSVPVSINGFIPNKGAFMSELRDEIENTAVKVMQKYS